MDRDPITAEPKDLAPEDPRDRDWWSDLHIRAFLSLVVADDKVERRERVWVKRFFEHSGHPELYLIFEQNLKNPTIPPLCDTARLARTHMDAAQTRMFVNSLAQMCKSKGSIADEEYGIIVDIAEAVGVPDTEADAIINSVFSINDTFVAIIGILAIGVMLYAMRVVLLPLVIAVFLTMIISHIESGFALRIGIRRGRWISKLVTMVVLFGVALMMLVAAAQAGSKVTTYLPFYESRFWAMFYEVAAFAEGLGIEGLIDTFVAQLRQFPVGRTISTLLGSVLTFAGNFLLITIFSGFLLFGGERFVNGGGEAANKITAYISVKSGMSVLTGVIVFALCTAFGIDFAVLWAIMAFLLNFIPSVGAIGASIPPVLLALVQLEGVGVALAFAFLLAGSHIVVGNVLEPKLMGDKLSVNPLAILFGLIFWGFLWGIPGMFLAAPLMSLLRVMSSQYNFSQPLERLLAA